MNLLGEDVEGLIFRLKHEIEFAPTLRLIKKLYTCAMDRVELNFVVLWRKWGLYSDPVKYKMYAPGGRMHKLMCLEWYKEFLRDRDYHSQLKFNFAKLRFEDPGGVVCELFPKLTSRGPN